MCIASDCAAKLLFGN